MVVKVEELVGLMENFGEEEDGGVMGFVEIGEKEMEFGEEGSGEGKWGDWRTAPAARGGGAGSPGGGGAVEGS